MMQIQNSRCDCCGLPVSDAQAEHCPNCTYPTRPSTEIAFLESAIQALEQIIANSGGQVPIFCLIHLSETTFEELKHLATYGGAELRLVDLAQISPKALEGYRRMKSLKGTEMTVPELVYLLETTAYGMRVLHAPAWSKVQVAGIIPLSESTIQQVRQIVALGGAELRVSGLVQLNTSTLQDFQRVVAHGGTRIGTIGLLRRYQSRLAYLNALNTLQKQVAENVSSAPVVPESQQTAEQTVQKLKTPEVLHLPVLPPSLAGIPMPPPPVKTTIILNPATPLPAMPSPSLNLPVQPPAMPSPSLNLPVLPSAMPSPSLNLPVLPPAMPSPSLNLPVLPPAMPSPSLNLPVLPPAMPSPSLNLPVLPPAMPVSPQYVPVAPPVPSTPRSRRTQEGLKTLVADSKSFFANSVMLVILLGAFLSLMASLFFAIDSRQIQPIVTLFVVPGTQILFIVFSLVTQRSRYPAVARIYASVFILLIALSGYELYKVLGGNAILTVQEITAIAALYTAVSFFAFAIYETYHPFGYFGVISLWVADIAATFALGLRAEWYPVMLMLLTLPSLLSIRPSSGTAVSGIERLIAGTPEILRKPVRYCMYILVTLCAVSILPLAGISFWLDSLSNTSVAAIQTLQFSPEGIRYSIVCMLLLLLIWRSLYLWLTEKQTGKLGLVWLFLACALAFAYSRQFPAVGYALTITGVALLYHSISRFVGSAQRSSGILALRLDQIALLLICIVPFISISDAIHVSFINSYIPSITLLLSSHFLFLTTSLILSMSTVLTISIALNRTKAVRGSETTSPQTSYWSWLLLLAGGLLCLTYSSALIASLVGEPVWVWWFLGLTLFLVAIAVAVRQRSGPSWANPLDIVAVSVALITIALGLQSNQTESILLLSFAALFYVVHLYQRQQSWLFLPTCFFIAALLLNMSNFWFLVAFTAIAALLGLTISRLTGRRWAAPLYIPALLSTVLTGIAGHTQADSLNLASWVLLAFVVIVYIVAIGEKQTAVVWLTPLLTTWSVIDTLLLYYSPGTTSSTGLFDLLRLPGIALLCAVVGVSISIAFRGRNAYARQERLKYVLPLYTAALVTAIVTCYYAFQPEPTYPLYITSLIVPGMLLLYAMIAAGVALFEQRAGGLWLVAGFGTPGIYFALQTNIDVVAGIGLGTAIIGVITGMVTRHKIASTTPRLDVVNLLIRAAGELLEGSQPDTAGWGDALKPFTWNWPWYLLTAVAATLSGLYSILGQPTLTSFVATVFPTHNVIEYSLLTFTVLFYLVALLEKQVGIAFFAIIFGSWALLNFAGFDLSGQAQPAFLVGIALLCVLIAGVVRLPRWVARGRTTGQKERRLAFTLPLYTMALFAAIITGIAPPIRITGLPDILPLILLGYAIIAYVIIAGERQPRWLFLPTGFFIAALLLNMSNFWFLVAFTAIAALLGLTISRLTGRRWAAPLYIPALLSTVLTGIAGYTQADTLNLASWALLAFVVIVYIVAIGEKQTAVVWLTPLLTTWSVIDTLPLYYSPVTISSTDLFDLLRLPGIALLCAVVGVSISMAFRGRNAYSRQERLKYVLPLYTAALVTAILTCYDAIRLETTSPSYIHIAATSLILPGMLVLYAMIAAGVALFEQRAGGLWLVAAFGTPGLCFALQTNIDIVAGIGLGTAIIGVITGMITRHRIASTTPRLDIVNLLIRAAGELLEGSQPDTAGWGDALKPFTWNWPWYLLTAVAATLSGLYSILGQPTLTSFVAVAIPTHNVIEYSLLTFTVLFYLVALLEKQVGMAFFAIIFGSWALLNFAGFDLSGQAQPAFLVGIALLCVLIAGVVRLPRWVARGRTTGQKERRLAFTLPLYTMALFAAIITGIASPIRITGLPDILPLILLGYGIIAYVIIAGERQPRWLFIAAGFAVWGTILIYHTAIVPGIDIAVWGTVLISHTAIVLGIGIGAALAGIGMKHLFRRRISTPGASGIWQHILPFTWTWPWYATTFVAALVIGLHQSMLSEANSLLVLAAFIYIIGLVERQSAILWVAAGFALWSAGDSTARYDLPHTFLDTYCAVFIASGISLFARRLHSSRRLHYTLPVYAIALCAAALTALSITFPHSLFSSSGVTIVTGIARLFGITGLPDILPLILLSYAIIAYVVIVFERQPRWLFIAAAFAVWGTALISQNLILLSIGIGAALAGMGIKQMIGRGVRNVPTAGTPGAWQSDIPFLPTWTWPWYATTITAAFTIGLRPTTPVVLSTADSLLAFAVLTYVIGIVERDQGNRKGASWILWVAACLALWSAGYSSVQNNAWHLFLDTYCAVILAVVIGLFGRRMSPGVEHTRLLRYTLPLYAVALCTTILTGLSGTGTDGILLLFDTGLAYVILGIEQRPRLMVLVAMIGAWGTVSVITSSMGATILLIIGLVAGCIGIVHSWKAFVPTKSAEATLSTLNKTDNQ